MGTMEPWVLSQVTFLKQFFDEPAVTPSAVCCFPVLLPCAGRGGGALAGRCPPWQAGSTRVPQLTPAHTSPSKEAAQSLPRIILCNPAP